MDNEKDLGKLGTVLAIMNKTNLDALDMLREQQKRQIRMVWASLLVVLVAFFTVGFGMYLTYGALEDLTVTIKEFHYVQSTEGSKAIPDKFNSD